MIVKKPYAFLIKHFKLIHLILSLFMIFVAIKSSNIFTFFSNYTKKGYYNYDANLASTYISITIFIAIILILLLTSFIYFLMKWKQKSRFLYIAISMFYFVLFIAFLAYFRVFEGLNTATNEARVVMAYRDISLIIFIPQLIFIVFTLIRATGFDIKKFDFKSDLQDLDIAEEDQEEVEVTFGQNGYKVKRFFRRGFRDFKYYALENKFFFFMILGIIVLVFVSSIILRGTLFRTNYKETDSFNINGISFNVEESYITNIDYKGNVINKGKNYIIVKLNIDNKSLNKSTLDTDSLRLMVDNDKYYPIYSVTDYFKDLGELYYKNSLYPAESYTYLIAYEIPDNIEYKKISFRMIDSVNYDEGKLNTKYKDITLDPIKYFGSDKIGEYVLEEEVNFKDSVIKDSTIKVLTYDTSKEYEEEYEYCTSDKCYTSKKKIGTSLSGNGKTTLIKLSMETNLDSKLYINKYIKDSKDFINYFGNIVVVNNNEETTLKTSIFTDISGDNVYIEVDDSVLSSEEVYLYLTIRNKVYKVLLKQKNLD